MTAITTRGGARPLAKKKVPLTAVPRLGVGGVLLGLSLVVQLAGGVVLVGSWLLQMGASLALDGRAGR